MCLFANTYSDWVRVVAGNIKPENLKSSGIKKEKESFRISDFLGKIKDAGTYNIVACIDHTKDNHNEGGAIREEYESNNCSTEVVFEVTGTPPAPIIRTIMVTSPSKGDSWRTDKEYKITWNTDNIPKNSGVKIESTIDDGKNWRTIDSNAANDGSKKWKPKDSGAKKDTNARIRITSMTYPDASATSDKFRIDHKK